MDRLVEKHLNSHQEYNRIYWERKKKGVDQFDLKRWQLLLKHYKGGRLADLGCLDSLAPILAKEKHPEAEIWGLDYAEQAIEDMKKTYPSIFWQVGDVYQTKFPNSYFQYVVAGEVLEHLENPKLFIKESFRILSKNGIIALSTPFKEKLGEVDKDRHVWSFTIEDVRSLLKPYGSVKIQLFPRIHIPFKTYHHKNIVAFCTKK